MNNRELYPVLETQYKQMEMLDSVLIKSTKTAKQAVQTMVAYSNTTQDAIASETGLKQSSVSRFINGNRGINVNELEAFINACGNLFLLQYLANKWGKKLVDIESREERIRNLEFLLEQERRLA